MAIANKKEKPSSLSTMHSVAIYHWLAENQVMHNGDSYANILEVKAEPYRN